LEWLQGCRQLVSELSSVGDELLQLAPAHDPPAGFESRVLAELTEPPRRRSIRPLARRWQWLFLATAGDRRLAASYRAVLSQGRGAYFLAAPLQGTRGRVLGGAKGTWRGQLPVDLSAVHDLRFVGSDGRTAFAATFATANPRD
jgi:hypothetical protein